MARLVEATFAFLEGAGNVNRYDPLLGTMLIVMTYFGGAMLIVLTYSGRQC
jgi:hypothetical protein